MLHVIVLLQIPGFQDMSSQKIKLGSVGMILRSKFRVLSENHPVFLGQKMCRSKSNIKIILTVFVFDFFNLSGIVQAEMLWLTLNIIRAYSI